MEKRKVVKFRVSTHHAEGQTYLLHVALLMKTFACFEGLGQEKKLKNKFAKAPFVDATHRKTDMDMVEYHCK